MNQMTPNQIKTLTRLSRHPLTTIDLTDEEIRAVHNLVRKNLARDYADFYRRRTPTHLRIWGISPLGKITLQQEERITQVTKRPQPYLIGLPQSSKDKQHEI